MESLFYLVSNIIVPIIVAILTVLLTVYFNEKSKKSKIIVTYNKEEYNNINKDFNNKENIIYGRFEENINIEKEFKNFLIKNENFATIHFDDLLDKTYNIYKNGIYKEDKIRLDNEENEICKMINYFKNNNDFNVFLKKHEILFLNSFWNIKVINIGKSKIYDVKIEFKDSVTKNKLIKKDFLDVSGCIELIINYFDKGIRVNTFDFGYNIPFEFGYSKYKKMILYFVKKKNYNKKDEIIFKISYLDFKAKRKEFYLCSKEVNIK